MDIVLEKREMKWLIRVLREEMDIAHMAACEQPLNREARENLFLSRRVLGSITSQLAVIAYEPDFSPVALDPSLN